MTGRDERLAVFGLSLFFAPLALAPLWWLATHPLSFVMVSVPVAFLVACWRSRMAAEHASRAHHPAGRDL